MEAKVGRGNHIEPVTSMREVLAGLAETQEVQQVLEELPFGEQCGWGSGCVGSMGARRGTPVAEVTVTRDTSSSTALCVLTRAVQGISPRLVRLYRHSSTVISRWMS